MKITIITSMRFKDTALEIAEKLRALGHKVKVPADSMKELTAQAVFDNDTIMRIHEHFIRSWIFSAVPWAELILLVNKKDKDSDHYFGINTSMELGAALYMQKPIVTLYDYDPATQEELHALKIPSLGGELISLEKYI